MPPLGFIILRCVQSAKNDVLWRECYRSIRLLYPEEPIIIIDDGSTSELLTELEMTNAEVIQSEFPGRGELLPYYYMWKMRPFRRAVFLHDSMFLRKRLEIDETADIKYLWHFGSHEWDNLDLEKNMISGLKYSLPLSLAYDAKQYWSGCFGCASVFTQDFARTMAEKYDFFSLLAVVKTREDRCCVERVLSVVAHNEGLRKNNCSYYGEIHFFPHCFRIDYDAMVSLEGRNAFSNQGCLKCWSGR